MASMYDSIDNTQSGNDCKSDEENEALLSNASGNRNQEKDENELIPAPSPVKHKKLFLGGVGLVFVVAAAAIISNQSNQNGVTAPNPTFGSKAYSRPMNNFLQQQQHSSQTTSSFPMPSGVNLGSWLSLEDYFYVGMQNAKEVATPSDGPAAAQCLPPLYVDADTGPSGGWHSETDLLQNLTTKYGLRHALQVFDAHRASFIDFESDLEMLQNLGILHVRVPLTWCLTDYDLGDYLDSHNEEIDDEELTDKFTCVDPFFGEDVKWPAVSRNFLVNFLRACAKHGITATLDLHTYPGGTSPGTFSGVWPRWPLFWTQGDLQSKDDEDDNNKKNDIGRTIYREFIQWIESLEGDDAMNGLRGISPMNEPAHLAGVFTSPTDAFLPALPEDTAEEFLAELSSSRPSSSDTVIPNGPHLRVMYWLHDAIQIFRDSKLPSMGKELAVNIHESIFNPNVFLPSEDDSEDPGGRHPAATRIVGAWWAGSTTPQERSTWAVLDMHHYHAWEPNCQGAVMGGTGANYTCDNVEARHGSLERCSSWVTLYRQILDEECGTTTTNIHHSNKKQRNAKLLSAEFSPSTHHLVRYACNDLTTLEDSYKHQVDAAKDANVELYFWSFKMPHGGAFRYAWSLKHFLYLMGVLSSPDESSLPCGSSA